MDNELILIYTVKEWLSIPSALAALFGIYYGYKACAKYTRPKELKNLMKHINFIDCFLVRVKHPGTHSCRMGEEIGSVLGYSKQLWDAVEKLSNLHDDYRMNRNDKQFLPDINEMLSVLVSTMNEMKYPRTEFEGKNEFGKCVTVTFKFSEDNVLRFSKAYDSFHKKASKVKES